MVNSVSDDDDDDDDDDNGTEEIMIMFKCSYTSVCGGWGGWVEEGELFKVV